MKGKNRKSKNTRTYSSTTYRIASVGAFVWGILVLLLGFVLLFIIPPLGILVSLFGWSCFFISNNFRKQAKRAKRIEDLLQHNE